MAYQYLMSARDGAVERLTLNRPDVRNAFNEHVIAELTDWAARTSEAAARHDIRAVVIAGAGKTFCAGADVTWMAKTVHYTEDENLRDAMAMSRMFAAINELPVAVIGRVQGAALGGGAGLAAVCDIVVAEDAALFGFTETKLGILPAVISPFALAKIGQAAARELFLTGARFPAARAQRDRPGARGGAGGGAGRGRRSVRPRTADRRSRSGRRREGADPERLGAADRRRHAGDGRRDRRPPRIARGTGRAARVSRQAEAGLGRPGRNTKDTKDTEERKP